MAPCLIVWGIAHASGTAASLLLNTEAAFTSLIAWHFAKEHISRRMILGLLCITAGGVLVSGNEIVGAGKENFLANLAITATCLCWAVDNNCTARLKEVPPVQFTFWKGAISGSVLLAVSIARHVPIPGPSIVVRSVLLGACCYGWALLTFVMSIQRLGAGRTSAFFATAPFIGATLSVLLLHEPITWHLLLAAGLMAGGVLALLTDPHQPVDN
jgi:drug/metabolite transporter (DMT)-like permease